MKTLIQVIQDNAWRAYDFFQSTAVNRLIGSGAVSTDGNNSADAIINAIDEENVQSIVTLGLSGYEWQEQNLGDATDTLAGAIEPQFADVNVKTFYGNQWWAVRDIEKDLLSGVQPEKIVLEKVGAYWAEQVNKIMSATVSGMGDITDITVGDGSANLSRALINEARKLKGDKGTGKLANLYMSSTTLFDVLDKQETGVITGKELITEVYGKVQVNQNGVTTTVDTDVPEYKYNGVTKIIVDDTMADGIVALVENGAFVYKTKNLQDPLMIDTTPKAGNGSGKKEWGTKALYICHPLGFSFKGKLGTEFVSKSGLSLAELQGGGLYELAENKKNAKIQIAKVKVG